MATLLGLPSIAREATERVKEEGFEMPGHTCPHTGSTCVVSGPGLPLKKTGLERLNNLSKVRQIVKARTFTEKLALQFFMTRDRKGMFDRNELQNK